MNNLACVKGMLKGATALTDSELNRIIKDFQRLKRIEERGSAGTQGVSAAQRAAQKEAEALRMAALITKENAKRNAIIHRSLLDEQGKYGGDIAGWAEAQIASSNKRVKGARFSVDSLFRAYEGKYLGGLVHDLRQEGVLQYVQARFSGIGKGPLDDKISIELWELDRDGGQPGSTGSPEAAKIATVIRKYQELARKDQNRLGAWIGKIPGYIVAQSHDMARIASAGFDEWYRVIRPLLDDERTFKTLDWDANATIMGTRGATAADEIKIKEFLRMAYVQISEGRFFQADTAGPLLGFKGPANAAKKASQSRSIHFKDAQSWIAYNDKFGSGSVMEAAVGGLTRAAKTASLMEKFGTNPRAMFERVVNDALDFAQRQGGKVDPRLKRGAFTSRLMDVADGTADNPANIHTAQIASAVRAYESWASLGQAVLSSLPDVATAASELNFQGQTFLGSLGEQFSEMAAQFTDGGKRREWGELMGVGYDAIIRDVASRMTSADAVGFKWAHKVSNIFFKLNLLSPFTNMGERGFTSITGRRLARLKAKAFADLPPELAQVLDLYSIGAKEWDVIRAHAGHVVQGAELLVPDKLRDMPLKDVDPLVEWPLEAIRLEAQRGLERMGKKAERIEAKIDKLTETISAQGEMGQTVADLKALRDFIKGFQRADVWAKRWNLDAQDASVAKTFRDASKLAKEQERIAAQHRAKIKSAQEKLRLSKKAEPAVLKALDDTMTALAETEKMISDWPAGVERQLNRRREEAVQNLETKLRAYYADRSSVAVLKGGIREKAYTTRGSQAGTVEGEAYRFAMQFKQYGISFIQKVFGRYAQEDRFWKIPGALFGMPKAEAAQFAQLIVTMTGLGYLSMAAKDIAKGREPRDPRDPRTWGAAFVQGGGAGIYGDFLFARVNRFGGSVGDTVMGPVLGDVFEGADIVLNGRDAILAAARGEDSEFNETKAFNFFKNNTPGINLFYTRAALDYLILYQMQEFLSPGSLRRMERRLKDDQGQEFILPPSETVN